MIRGDGEMKKTTMMLLSTLVVFSFLIVSALAAPTGASITGNANETWTPPSASNFTAYGGNITEMNLSAYQVTGSWVGFWGELTGGVTLRDASGNIFYQWTVNNMTGAAVYACNESSVSWSTISPAGASNVPSYINDGGTDDFNNTFTSSETFTSASLNVANTNYTTTQGSAGFKTYALYDTTNTVLIWAGKAINNGAAFNSGTADYQILAPADGSGQTYYFYLEMP